MSPHDGAGGGVGIALRYEERLPAWQPPLLYCRSRTQLPREKTVPNSTSQASEEGGEVRGDLLARLLWRLRHDRSGANRLKFAWKILQLRQVGLSDERILENFRTFSVGRPVGYP